MGNSRRKKLQPKPLNNIFDIFLNYREVLASVIRRIVGSNDIEDIVQETFIATYNAGLKNEIRHPKSFMLKTAKNLALNHVNKSDNKLVDSIEEIDSSNVYPVAQSLEAEFESNEKFLLFCRAVRQLNLQCRRAFILKKFYGFSQREIAEHLKISESAVEKHVAKGIFVCGEYLEAHGYPVYSRKKTRQTPLKRNSRK